MPDVPFDTDLWGELVMASLSFSGSLAPVASKPELARELVANRSGSGASPEEDELLILAEGLEDIL